MLTKYFVIALRSIQKSRLYTLINLTGLSIGIAASLLIALFVFHEFSYDNFHSNADRIFQMQGKVNYGGQEINLMGISAAFGPLAKENDAAVENFARVKFAGKAIIKADKQEPRFEEGVLFADPSFFDLFSFRLMRGNPQSLTKLNSVIVSERVAKKYFGDEYPISKILTLDNQTTLQVAGVVANPSSNSSLQFDFVVSFVTLGTLASEKNQYEHPKASLGSYSTYLMLRDKSAKANVEKTLNKIASNSVDEKYSLIPFADQHLNSSGTSATANYLIGFLAIAGIILILALTNYISLTTARATLRAKEVGVRKVIGARRGDLSIQFFIESALITTAAFLLAFGIVQLALPTFLSTLDLQIDLSFLYGKTFGVAVAALFVFCIFIAGYYPALVLSRFKPLESLSGKLSARGQGSWLRKSFTTLQFAASIGLMFGSVVIIRQMDFMKNKKLGLNKEMVLVVNLSGEEANHIQAIKNDLRAQSGIVKVSSASFQLFNGGTSGYFTKTPITQEEVFINVIAVDEEFFSTLNIPWKLKPTETSLIGQVVVNETGLTKLKLQETDLGKSLDMGRWSPKVIGIVKDFHYQPLSSPIGGLAISVLPDTSQNIARNSGALYVRLSPTKSMTENLSTVQTIFKKYQNSRPFDYYFLDDAFDRMFKSEARLSTLFNAFTMIAIFLACLGLLGLITFTSETKTKEIGIRKILGASVRQIISLLFKEYVLLMVVSMILVSPVAWWYLQQWLNQFPEKIEITAWYPVMATVASVLLAFISTLYQSINSAMKNPVDSLRSE